MLSQYLALFADWQGLLNFTARDQSSGLRNLPAYREFPQAAREVAASWVEDHNIFNFELVVRAPEAEDVNRWTVRQKGEILDSLNLAQDIGSSTKDSEMGGLFAADEPFRRFLDAFTPGDDGSLIEIWARGANYLRATARDVVERVHSHALFVC